MSYKAGTLASSGKGKAALSDINQLRSAIRQLQKDGQEQLTLEYESQATFDYFHGQVNSIQKGFKTLSDVLLEELDTLRTEYTKRVRGLDSTISTHHQKLVDLQRELNLLKKTFEVWSLKERDWAKDNEILKISHAHNAEWMQQIQRDMMEVRETVHSIKSDHVRTTKHISEECENLKSYWEQHIITMKAKVQELESTIDRQTHDLRALGQQRLDDLDLVEKALSTVQNQQLRLRGNVEETLQTTHADRKALQIKVETIEGSVSQARLELAELRSAVRDEERESRVRFDNISRVFKVFSDALHIAPPYFTVASTRAKDTNGPRPDNKVVRRRNASN